MGDISAPSAELETQGPPAQAQAATDTAPENLYPTGTSSPVQQALVPLPDSPGQDPSLIEAPADPILPDNLDDETNLPVTQSLDMSIDQPDSLPPLLSILPHCS